MSEFGSIGLENRIAVFGGVFLGLGLVLLFILFFWVLKRSRFAQDKEEKGYGGLIRFLIFAISILLISLAWLFFQMQNYLRPFQVLLPEKLVGELTIEPIKDSSNNLFFNATGKKGEIYKETFEVSKDNRFELEAEILIWQKWLKFFGFVDGYKLTLLGVFSSDTSNSNIKTFELSGGPTEGWSKISSLKKFLPLVKPEKIKSDIFISNPGETKKVYIKEKKLVVE
ncbi:MAG: hypothetical protein MUP17_05170 [candidate division Zixibacteria bacterium]|nr:hypothetical protein [candidate division Zixibacteria bacterium]